MAGRPAKLSDPHLRDRLLDQIRAGHGRYAACRAVQVSPSAFTAYLKANPDFQDELDAALAASAEPVLSMLREKALDEYDSTAAQIYLKHTAPPPEAKAAPSAEINLTINTDAPALERIRELQARLAQRDAPAELPEIVQEEDDAEDV